MPESDEGAESDETPHAVLPWQSSRMRQPKFDDAAVPRAPGFEHAHFDPIRRSTMP